MTACERSRLAVPLVPAAGGHVATLHGELLRPPAARALILRLAACEAPATIADTASNATSDALAGHLDARLHASGCATLAIDLLESGECRFADADRHLPHLCERLLALLAWLQRQYDADALPPLPVGLLAAGTMAPAAVRAAAVRDRLVGALVCHGGLIDLAGLQYLHALRAPLLLLCDAEDRTSAANFDHARSHLAGIAEKRILPAGAAAPDALADATVDWFFRHLGPARSGRPAG